MSQKPNFQKSAIHKPAPRKQGIFLTVRANWFFEQTSNEKGQPPRCYPLVSSRLGLAYQYAEARRCNGVAVGVCALGVVLGVVAHVVKVVRVVGDGVAVVVLLLVGRSRVGGCCSAPDVLARLPARIKREKE